MLPLNITFDMTRAIARVDGLVIYTPYIVCTIFILDIFVNFLTIF